MKKTFTKDDEIAVDCKGSLALKKFLVEYALSKNVPVFGGTLEHIKSNNGEFPNIAWSCNEVCGTHSTPDNNRYNKTWISVEEFMDYCDNYKQTTVRLNNEYSAEINTDDKTIKVGCQVISFEAVRELYEAIYN